VFVERVEPTYRSVSFRQESNAGLVNVTSSVDKKHSTKGKRAKGQYINPREGRGRP